MFEAIVGLAKQLIEASGSIVGVRHGTEEPMYTVEQVSSGVEIRHYGPRIAAQTTVAADEEAARSKGFSRLARYIFGGNHDDTKIAMTAPVAQQDGAVRGEKISMTAPVSENAASNGEWLIRFFMPAGKSITSLPQPNDQAVRLVTVPAETVAVRRFSGSISPRAVASQTAELVRTLRDEGFEPIGTPAAWFYDPPWTIPMLRRNELPYQCNHVHERKVGMGMSTLIATTASVATASIVGGRASRPRCTRIGPDRLHSLMEAPAVESLCWRRRAREARRLAAFPHTFTLCHQ